MTSRDDLAGALDECGIPWRENGFAPRKPPEPPYAVLRDTATYDGSDMHVGMIGHDSRIMLYDLDDNAGREKRAALAVSLATRNVHFTRYPSDYSYDLKLYETEFYIDDTYYEKWSD